MIPLSRIGSEVIERSHSSDCQVSAASTSSGGSASRGRLSDQMPGDGSGGSRSSCSRQAGTGESTVTQMAANPLASARATRSRVSSRSVNQYSWNHGFVTVGPTSSNRTLAPELMTIVVPRASAARAVASSASGCANRWRAVGANRIGSAIVRPRMVTEVSMWLTSMSPRCRNRQRVYASMLPRPAVPVPAAPAMKL